MIQTSVTDGADLFTSPMATTAIADFDNFNAGDQVTFTVDLAPASTSYFGYNVDRLKLYRKTAAAKVDQLMALVDQLETQLAASRATATNLLSALVAELAA